MRIYRAITNFAKQIWFSLEVAKIDSTSLVLTGLLFLLSLFAFNNKVLFILTTAYVVAILLHTKSVFITFLYGYLALQTYQVGQLYNVRVIEPEQLIKNSFYPEGRSLFYILTPSLIITATATFSLFVIFVKKQFKNLLLSLSFFGYSALLLTRLISAVNSQEIPSLSVFFTLTDIFLLGWLMEAVYYLKTYAKKLQEKIVITACAIIIMAVTFEASVTTGQFLKRGIIGLNIEVTKTIPLFGVGADENPLQFRPVGLSVHANILTSKFIALLYSILVINSFVSYDLKRNNLWRWCLVGGSGCTLILILAQSRTGFVGIILPILAVATINWRVVITGLKTIFRILTPYKLLLLPVVILTSYIITDRLLHIQYVFSETGGWNTRRLLIEEASRLIYQHPLLGVGTGMFIPAAFNNENYGTHSLSIMRYFPEAVHNGYFLLAAEGGLVSLFIFIITVIMLVKEISVTNFTLLTKSFIIAGVAANLLYMVLQPYIMTLPINIIFTYLLLAYDQSNQTARGVNQTNSRNSLE